MNDVSARRDGTIGLPDPCYIHLAVPQAHTATRLRGQLGGGVGPSGEGILTLCVRSGAMRRLCDDLAGMLTPGELDDARVLLAEDDAGFTPGDLLRMEPLSAVIVRVRASWVADLIRERRLAFHFQPIVYARSPEAVFGHECLVRGVNEDGTLIPPLDLYRDARASGLLAPLDRAARLGAIDRAAALSVPGRLFVHYDPASVYDAATCLGTTMAAIERAGLAPGRITFELVVDERIDAEFLTGIVRHYRSAGFRIALDDLGAGYGSLNLLSAVRPDFLKLDRELVRDVDRDPYKGCVLKALLGLARDLAIETIAEGIETVAELDWIVRHGGDYAQGYLIAAPSERPVESSMRPAPLRVAQPA